MNDSGAEPLSPRRKWATITAATLLLLPAYWSLLAGMVATATDDRAGEPNPAAALALGLAVIPFVFILLAFMSSHPRAPGAVLKAMGVAILIGLPASALAADAITGMVAGAGAGGVIALRADADHNWKARAIAVAIAVVYTFVLVRMSPLGVLAAPIFPFTAIGVADHLSERRRMLEASRT